MTFRPIVAAALLLALTGCGQAPVSPTAATAGPTALTAQAGKAQTPLQKHVAYFDTNHDGLIKLDESVPALRALGLGPVTARLFAAGVHGALGPKTSGRMTTEIKIAMIHTGVHAGSINYDSEGKFKAASFVAMFKDYDTNQSGALSKSEVQAMLKARKASNVTYALSSTAFKVLFAVAADSTDGQGGDAEPALTRARMTAFYDGTLFTAIAKAKRGEETAPVELPDLKTEAAH